MRPFHFLFDDGTESFLRTTMAVEDVSPGVQLLTNAEIQACTCNPCSDHDDDRDSNSDSDSDSGSG